MLIKYSVKNYKSFKDETTFYFSASKIKNHPKHIIDSKDKLLMYLGIYGPNSSGKTILLESMGLVKKVIFKGTNFLKQSNFNNSNDNLISKFTYEIKKNNKKYEFSYSVDTKNKAIVDESLYDITRKNKKIIYERNLESKNFNYSSAIKKRSLFLSTLEEMKENNQYLFLGELKKRTLFATIDGAGYDDVSSIYDFLMYDTVLFSSAPIDLFNINYLRRKDSLIDVVNLFGIDLKDMVEEPFSIDELSEVVSKRKFLRIINTVDKSSIKNFTLKVNNNLFTIHKENENIIINRIVFIYKNFKTSTINLGMQKILELSYILISKDKLFLIDEFDYNLHPINSRNFLDLFFKVKNKNQIITTGHEALNLDFNLVRRDEIWFTSKNEKDETIVFPLENFKSERFDKKISKAYLNGEYGAIPKSMSEDEKPKVIILKNDYRRKK